MLLEWIAQNSGFAVSLVGMLATSVAVAIAAPGIIKIIKFKDTQVTEALRLMQQSIDLLGKRVNALEKDKHKLEQRERFLIKRVNQLVRFIRDLGHEIPAPEQNGKARDDTAAQLEELGYHEELGHHEDEGHDHDER
jgi:prefoldin subunit 5